MTEADVAEADVAVPPEEVENEPALLRHCRNVYQAMHDQSKPDLHGQTYEGFLTHLITDELNLSVPYYTSVMKKLKAMDCVRQLRRGGSTTPSQWLLLQEPTLEMFEATPSGKSQKPVNQMSQDFNSRLSSLEEKVDLILGALADDIEADAHANTQSDGATEAS